MDELIEQIAYNMSVKHGRNEVEVDALYSLLNSKLHKEKEKWNKKSLLSSFLNTIAHNCILRYKSEGKLWLDKLIINSHVDTHYIDNSYNIIEDNIHKDTLLETLKVNTTAEEYEIICRYFGLDNYKKHTAKAIYKETYITPSEQKTIIKNVFNKLKTNDIIIDLYKSL